MGHNREFYLARLDIKHRIGTIPLRKDSVFPREKHKLPARADGREECMGIEIAPVFGGRSASYGVALISPRQFDGLLAVPHKLTVYVRPLARFRGSLEVG